MSYDEMDVLSDRFGDGMFYTPLNLEARTAYDKWCVKFEKEPSDGGRMAFKMKYVSALIAAGSGTEVPPEMDEHADMTKVELAEMREHKWGIHTQHKQDVLSREICRTNMKCIT